MGEELRALRALGLAAAMLGGLCGQSSAHTPYLKPSIFEPFGEWTSIQAAYSTEIFCPIVGIGSSNFHVVMPDGRSAPFSTVYVTPDETTLELRLPSDGTYRLTTGEVVSSPYGMIYERRRWRALRPGEAARPRVRVTTMQVVTVAEAYITKGEPTRAALEPIVGTLAIRPITHPNQVTVASGLVLQLLYNGAPFPNMPFVVYARGQSEDDMHRTFVTDADGRATLTFQQPGTYLAVVRYRPRMPAGADAEVRSYSTSLTFEVRAAP
jgi:hypothetical protein